MNCPWLRQEVKDTRSEFEKIKDGIVNSRTLMYGGFSLNALLAISHTLTKTGEPTLSTLGAVTIFLCHAINTYSSYKNSYNSIGG